MKLHHIIGDVGDEVSLYDDGLHGDGEANDNYFGGNSRGYLSTDRRFIIS